MSDRLRVRCILGGLLLLAPVLAVVVDAGPPGPARSQVSLLALAPAMPHEGGGDNGSQADEEQTLSWGDPDAPAPIPVLTLLDGAGVAPFTVHVHALDSDLGVGDPLTAHYEWDFGDAGSAYNELVGFNAAHVYDEPGQYTVTLCITNECGRQAELTAPITVFPDTRPRLYVAGDGNDNNDGQSPAAPIRTFARAMELLEDDMVVLLRRGDRFGVPGAPSSIARRNWALGAWGEGDRPELCWVGGIDGGAILPLSADQCAAALIEDVHFTSKYAGYPDRDICTAIFVGGENITVRRCSFGHVTDALNCNRQPRGVLSCDNVATGLRAYYLWGEGWDHTHLGNVVLGSTHEHNIRFGGIHRVLIADNELTNSPKRCLWAMLGEYAWITGNTMSDGRLTIGPDHTDGGGAPSDRFRHCVAERNIIDKVGFPETAAVEVEHGAEHVILRNNVISIAGNSTIAVRGYSETKQRTTVDLRIFNNTGICPGTCGRFVRCGTDTESLHIANNLFIAPELITGDYQKAILFILDEDLSGFVQIGHNLWPIPAGCDWGEDVYHYLWPYWANLEGCKDIAEWAACGRTRAEAYENVTLDDDYRPAVGSGAEGHAARVPGVFTDLTGAPRPADGGWTAGAVEVPQ
ncbi:MAG: PKD domain-containing protein [Planctomycetota bacterium]|nr:PKD domain-containing protein [Planctomycetota bacterium]